MLELLKKRLREVVKAVGPLVVAGCVLEAALGQADLSLFVQFLAGSVLAIAGMVLLFIGIELGILPMGRFIGADLPERGSLWLIVGVAFALGVVTTIAEPDVLVLATEAQSASSGAYSAWTLVYVIALGVGLFVALALLRVVWGVPMVYLLAGTYGAMLLLSFVGPVELVPLAYDAGSVTTGVLTAPVVLALALGLSSVLAERSAVSDGFGLLGLGSAGSIVAVLLFALLR
jgi:hypothetical protein